MNLENLLPFVLATAVILIVPGPTIILVIGQSITHGRKSVIPLVAGVLLGDFTAMTASLLGLGALLSTSAALFSMFKWIGALYLLYLGIKLWKSNPEITSPNAVAGGKTARALFRSSFIVTSLNPKSIAFFIAFLPQFIDLSRPVVSQFIILGCIFLFLAVVNAALYALFADTLRKHIKNRSVRRWFNRCGGSALIGAGVLTATVQQAS